LQRAFTAQLCSTLTICSCPVPTSVRARDLHPVGLAVAGREMRQRFDHQHGAWLTRANSTLTLATGQQG
jgi:hypothetical protein